MNQKEESSAEKDNPAIIMALWLAGKSLHQISAATGLKISTISKILRGTQKALIQKGR